MLSLQVVAPAIASLCWFAKHNANVDGHVQSGCIPTAKNKILLLYPKIKMEIVAVELTYSSHNF